jgi:N-acetylmuramoyl-L-alanine amidase
MSRKVLTAAVAALSFCTFGVFAASGPASAVWAGDSPDDIDARLLPRSVIDAAAAEGETPAMPTLSIDDLPEIEDEAPRASSLSALVAQHGGTAPADREAECLAGAIYFESKGEPLDGQLAVAQTILNRTTSGRFPRSVCSVVFQPGQFSFVRGGGFPPIARGSRHWREATAIAHIAANELWDASVSNALFFHARHVSPGWRMRRIGSVGNHVFYR